MLKLKSIGFPFFKTQQGHFNPTTDKVENAKNKILNLLHTRRGQRVLSQNCQFGLDLQRLLFQNIGYQDFQQKAAKQIERSIRRWIREVDKLEVNVELAQHKVKLRVNFSIDYTQDSIFMEYNVNEIT